MRLVFDTSVLIDALRRHQDAQKIIAHFEQADEELCVPSIIGFELFSGKSAGDNNQRQRIRRLLQYFEVIDLTLEIARRAGDIYRSGVRDLQVPDYLIAATALEINAPVVTLNRKHFARIPGVELYSLQ